MSKAAAFSFLCAALVACGTSGAVAQVRLLGVGQARAGATADPVAGVPWMQPVAVRSYFDYLLFPLRFRELTPYIAGAGLVPGLTGPCTPQGIAALPDGRIVLSYHVDKPVLSGPAAAVIVVTDPSGAVQMVRELQDHNGLPLPSHVGGIAYAGGYLWTGSAGRIYRFPVPTGTGRWLRAERIWLLDSTVSWVAAFAGTLWVGDYYKTGEKPAGRGWAAGYTLDRTQSQPLAYTSYQREGRTVLRPDAVIYLPTTVQGFAVNLGHIFLSRSHGPKHGDLEVWRSPFNTTPRTVALPEGVTTIGWDLTNLERSLPVPSGPEDLEWAPPYLLMTFESGCQAYRDELRAGGAAIEDRFLFLRMP